MSTISDIKRIPKRTNITNWTVIFNQDCIRIYTRAESPVYVDISCYVGFVIREMAKLNIRLKEIIKRDGRFKNAPYTSNYEAVYIELVFEPIF